MEEAVRKGGLFFCARFHWRKVSASNPVSLPQTDLFTSL